MNIVTFNAVNGNFGFQAYIMMPPKANNAFLRCCRQMRRSLRDLQKPDSCKWQPGMDRPDQHEYLSLSGSNSNPSLDKLSASNFQLLCVTARHWPERCVDFSMQ